MRPIMSQNDTDLLRDEMARRLRPALPGLFFAVLTILFSFVLGIVFGANEMAIKSRHEAAAVAVRDSVYGGDDAAIKTVLDKSWVYAQRAHLHGGAIGTTAVGLILIVLLLRRSPCWSRWLGLGLGLGGFGYSLYWLLASFRAPAMGSTGIAKESLAWLAMPSSGAVVISTLIMLVLLALEIFRPKNRRESGNSTK